VAAAIARAVTCNSSCVIGASRLQWTRPRRCRRDGKRGSSMLISAGWRGAVSLTVCGVRRAAGAEPVVTYRSSGGNNGSSPAVATGLWSKLDTVTPIKRTPLAAGSTVRTRSTLV
jgi:hypothetical protein